MPLIRIIVLEFRDQSYAFEIKKDIISKYFFYE